MLQDLFKVETLDTRFASKTGEPISNTSPSKWRTSEYYLYYLGFATIPFFMFKSVYDVSKPNHPGYAKFEPLLSPGWIPGRMLDNSDDQYRTFRDNIPYMAVVLILHPLLRRAYEWLSDGQNVSRTEDVKLSSPNSSSALSAPDAERRKQRRMNFDLAFAVVFLLALYGISTFKILLILFLNFKVATALPRQYVALTTWTFNIGILFANELCGGYRFAGVLGTIFPANATGRQDIVKFGAWIDGFGGLIGRWEVLFNITVLRLIAFNFDYLWSLDRRASSPVEKKTLDPTNLSERDRVASGAAPSDFTLSNYLAYALYSPLYLAGPIINFNDYISQSTYRPASTSRARILPYALRFGVCLLTMELVLHYLYAVAICKSHPDWASYTPFQLSMLGYFNLHVIWLKLLLPWRLFRLWALCDGIDPPENMVRCMSDNYSALAFWRGWHRSFNRWVVRYVYVPLGGSRADVPWWRAALNYTAVFTFVALWHDINLRLLIWGWLIVLFLAPEVLARLLFPPKSPYWSARPNAYRWLCGAGAVGNVLMMMSANLVGFAVGLDGLQGLVDGIVGSWGGRLFLVAACGAVFMGVQVMFEWRMAERRRGVDVKC